MRKVRIAQVGTGHDHAISTYRSIVAHPEAFELIGVAEPNPERVKDIYPDAPRCTVDELLARDDLDAVAIETEESLSTEYAQLFADKGIAIHLDKPGAQNLESFTKLIETVKAKKLPFQMGYMYRYNPMIREALDMAKSGELGEIFSVEAQMSVCHDPAKRAWLGQFRGGMLYFLGCHLIDLVYQIQGEPEEIIPMNMSTGIDCGGAEDYGFAVMKYKNGVSFVKSCATEYGGYRRRQIVICGSKGTIEIKPTEINVAGPGQRIRTPEHMTLEKNGAQAFCDCAVAHEIIVDRYDNMMLSFARNVLGEEEMLCSPDYELALFKLIMKCCGAL